MLESVMQYLSLEPCTTGSRFVTVRVFPPVVGVEVRAASGGRSPTRYRSLCPAGLGL